MAAVSTFFHAETLQPIADVSLLRFRAPKKFTFTPGQHGLWIVGTNARPFTIASAPGEDFVEIATRLSSGSRMKRALGSLRPGERVRFLGPVGNLQPPEDDRPVVIVAQGIGVTPARSIIKASASGMRTLIHVGTPYFKDELAPLAECVYPADRSELRNSIDGWTSRWPMAHYLLSGSFEFVRATKNALTARGIASGAIRQDPFLGLPAR